MRALVSSIVASALLVWFTVASAQHPPRAQESPSDGSEQAAGVESEPYAEQDYGKFLRPEIGAVLVARASVEAWEQYPTGILLSSGDLIRTVVPGESHEVLETKSILSLFGNLYFIKVRPTAVNERSEGTLDYDDYWVFQGREGAELPENFLPEGVWSTNRLTRDD